MAEAFKDDPDWLLARAAYLYPDADDPAIRMALRVLAAQEMHQIEGRYDAA